MHNLYVIFKKIAFFFFLAFTSRFQKLKLYCNMPLKSNHVRVRKIVGGGEYVIQRIFSTVSHLPILKLKLITKGKKKKKERNMFERHFESNFNF